MSRVPNPEKDPETAFVSLTEDRSKVEQAVADNYRAFSAEMLRLSLLGIAVVGFIYENIFDILPVFSKHSAAISLIFFGMAAASALIHRYFNGETVRLYVWGLRFHESKRITESRDCLKSRESIIIICIIAKAASAVFLGIGALLLAIAFTSGLWHSPNPALQVQSKVSEAGRAAELGRWGAVQGFNRLRVISMIDEAKARELNQRRPETIEKRYAEICANIRALDENSFRLLGFVPLLSASAIAAVLLRDVKFSPTVVLFSLVGGIVTFGLYRWELRNIQICKWLQERADEIEQREFGIEIAEQQFAIRLKPEREKPQFKNAEYNDMHKLFGIPFTQRRAETLIYWTTIIGWFALPLILALSPKITAPS